MKPAILLLACSSLLACSIPPTGAPSAPAAAANLQPAACPEPTETLYVPQMPAPGFVPAPPAGATLVAPRRLLAAEPAWSAASIRCREQGKVTITYCVSATGAVENVLVVISSGYARLDNAVLGWAARDRHTPGTVNGRPRLYCGMRLEQEFELPEATVGQTAR